MPTVIKTAEENRRMLAIVDKLMAKGEGNLTRGEDALLELLVDLIHDFEEKHDPLPKSEPQKMVAFLLQQRGMKASDLWPVLGSKSRTSELLSGKRGLSKDQAKNSPPFSRCRWASSFEDLLLTRAMTPVFSSGLKRNRVRNGLGIEF